MSETGRVFITGGTGFIGSHLAKRLILESGGCVRALVRNPDEARWLDDLGVEILPGDITEPSTLRGVMDDCQTVYHSAAWVSESGSKDRVWAVNVTGTRNVVDVLQAQRAVYKAKRDYANARYDYVINTLQLKQAAGQLSPEDVQGINRWMDDQQSTISNAN